jgi:hypothetical protein
MDTFNPNKGESEEIRPDGFENSAEFIKLENEMRELVKKSMGDDKNLTGAEIQRRNDIYKILKPPIPDLN